MRFNENGLSASSRARIREFSRICEGSQACSGPYLHTLHWHKAALFWQKLVSRLRSGWVKYKSLIFSVACLHNSDPNLYPVFCFEHQPLVCATLSNFNFFPRTITMRSPSVLLSRKFLYSINAIDRSSFIRVRIYIFDNLRFEILMHATI